MRRVFDAFYGPGARIYDRLTELLFVGEWRRWQETALQEIAPDGLVVELGCGTGALAVSHASTFAGWIGIERSLSMLSVARGRGTSPGVVLVRGDAAALPVRTKSADVVIATFPSGYILQERVIAETRRVLKADGRLVVVLMGELKAVGLRRSLVRAVSQIVIGQAPGDGGHYPKFVDFAGAWMWRETDYGRALVFVGHPITTKDDDCIQQ